MTDEEEEFLLDTNVISESLSKRPNKCVMEWLDVFELRHSYISAITIGEIRKGINLLKHSEKRVTLERWLTKEVCEIYKGHILPVDTHIADCWGSILAEHPGADAIDGLLAATALSRKMTLVTRNEKHFNIPQLRIMNPWKQ